MNNLTKQITQITAGVALCLLVLTSNTKAQIRTCHEHFKIGLNASNYVNGNGHGGFYNLSAVINSHSSTLTFGLNWQKAQKEFNGIGVTYSYSVLGNNTLCGSRQEQYNKREELLFFCTVNYYKNARLSNKTIEGEGDLSEGMNEYYTSLKITTLESFVGLGYNYYLNKNIKLRSFIGIGYYNHLNYSAPSYHDKGATVLMTGIGIGFIN